MRKSTEEMDRLTCRIPKRLLSWLDHINPGNRTYALRKILEDAYERHSSGGAGDAATKEPDDNPQTSRQKAVSVRSQ